MYAIILYDTKEDVMTVVDENLSLIEAKEGVMKLRKKGLPAFHIAQKNLKKTVKSYNDVLFSTRTM